MEFLTRIFLTSIFFFIVSVSKSQNTQNDLILGKWIFEEFLYPYDATEEKQQADKANKGLVITFSVGDKYKSEQKSKVKRNNASGLYKILPGDKIILIRDTFSIVTLNEKHLKLSLDSNHPIVVFKKL